MRPSISIKPHHFVDIITSFGSGERTFHPHPYGHALHTVAQRILDERDVHLVIDVGIDDICKPCIHHTGGVCDDTIDTSYRPEAPASKNAWNLLIDGRWCERLHIKQGDRFSARALCARIRDRMGDITGIYREIPASMTMERAANLVKGIEYYLGQEKSVV